MAVHDGEVDDGVMHVYDNSMWYTCILSLQLSHITMAAPH